MGTLFATSAYRGNLAVQNKENIVKNSAEVENTQGNISHLTFNHISMFTASKFFGKITTIVVVVATFMVGVETIVGFCDNCDWCCDNHG